MSTTLDQAHATADLTTIVLARELVDAAQGGVRVLAVTSPLSLIAGLCARRLGAAKLGMATGFGTLDARPVASLGDPDASAGGIGGSRGPASDTFVALARGLVAVAVTPAQLDGTGAVNLSGIGHVDDRPAVALPGSRGLAENNDSPSRVLYVMTAHSPRALVEHVDFVSGPAPESGRYRRLITPMGVFTLDADAGWRAVTVTAGVEPSAVEQATGFAVRLDGAGPTPAVTDHERAALDVSDPNRIRSLPFLVGEDATAHAAGIVAAEAPTRPATRNKE